MRPRPRKSTGYSRHAAGKRCQLGGVGEDINYGKGISINIARAGDGQAKQARRERTSSCEGQYGRPAEGEGKGTCCPRRGWCNASAALCEQTDEGGCFSAPPATNLDAKHRQMAASGIDKLRVSSPLGVARGLEGSSCSAAVVVPWSPGCGEGCNQGRDVGPESQTRRLVADGPTFFTFGVPAVHSADVFLQIQPKRPLVPHSNCDLRPYERSCRPILEHVHRIALHCIALHCIALHCIALHPDNRTKDVPSSIGSEICGNNICQQVKVRQRGRELTPRCTSCSDVQAAAT